MGRAWRKSDNRSASFNPSHSDIDSAIQAFLSSGGEIMSVEDANNISPEVLPNLDNGFLADSFLLGSNSI